MTTEERPDRLEHFTAGMADQWQREREENRQLWRDTQRQISDTQRHLDALAVTVAETNMTVARLGGMVTRLGEEMREADKRLGDRIDALVSAIGKFLDQRKS